MWSWPATAHDDGRWILPPCVHEVVQRLPRCVGGYGQDPIFCTERPNPSDVILRERAVLTLREPERRRRACRDDDVRIVATLRNRPCERDPPLRLRVDSLSVPARGRVLAPIGLAPTDRHVRSHPPPAAAGARHSQPRALVGSVQALAIPIRRETQATRQPPRAKKRLTGCRKAAVLRPSPPWHRGRATDLRSAVDRRWVHRSRHSPRTPLLTPCVCSSSYAQPRARGLISTEGGPSTETRDVYEIGISAVVPG